MNTEERWKAISGYEGIYEVSDRGRVKSLDRINHYKRNIKERILKPRINNRGYCHSYLYINGVAKSIKTHRLVAIAFIPNPNDYPFVNHIDGIKTNNYVNNLEWCTRLYNVRHAFTNGLMVSVNGSKHGGSKLTEEDVIDIRIRLGLGESKKGIARLYGVSDTQISRIGKKLSWSHL